MSRQSCHGAAESLKSVCGGLGTKAGMSAESHQWPLSVQVATIGIPWYEAFFSFLLENTVWL